MKFRKRAYKTLIVALICKLKSMNNRTKKCVCAEVVYYDFSGELSLQLRVDFLGKDNKSCSGIRWGKLKRINILWPRKKITPILELTYWHSKSAMLTLWIFKDNLRSDLKKVLKTVSCSINWNSERSDFNVIFKGV